LKTDNLKSLLEQVIQEINGLNEFALKIETNSLANIELDTKLREREKKLDERESGLVKREDALKENTESLAKKLEEINQKEEVIIKLGDIKEEIRKKREDLDIKKAENEKKIEELDKKIKDYDFLADKEKEIEHRETLMAKETLLDRDRKEKLDIRENQLKTEAERLQKIASS